MDKEKLELLLEERQGKIEDLESHFKHYTWVLDSIQKKLDLNRAIEEDITKMLNDENQ